MRVMGTVCSEDALQFLVPLDSMAPLSLAYFPSTMTFPFPSWRGTSLRYLLALIELL